MATNTTLVSYALYDFNNKHGKVAWIDNSDQLALAVSNILAITGLT